MGEPRLKAGDLVVYRRRPALGMADTLAAVVYRTGTGPGFSFAVCTPANPYLTVLVAGRFLEFVSTKGAWYVHRWYVEYRSAKRGPT